MPAIRNLLPQSHAFSPEQVEAMSRAFADAANTLGIVETVNGPGSRKESLAKLIIELAKDGEPDPYKLSGLAVKRMRERVEGGWRPGAFARRGTACCTRRYPGQGRAREAFEPCAPAIPLRCSPTP